MSQESREEYEVTLLTESQIPQVSQILAKAFHNDPIAQYMIRDEQERAKHMADAFSVFTAYAFLAGEIWTTAGEVKGAALWFPPAHTEMIPKHMEAAGFEDLPSRIGEGATERMFQILEHIEQFHKRDMPHPHWYLMLLGIEPSEQGKGIGRSLVRTMLEQADREGASCYLETTNPRNISFYNNLGFKVMVEDVDPESSIRFWTFNREPLKVGTE
jgi:ribosomal protein S18 acetylase RimI-like enzyme